MVEYKEQKAKFDDPVESFKNKIGKEQQMPQDVNYVVGSHGWHTHILTYAAFCKWCEGKCIGRELIYYHNRRNEKDLIDFCYKI